MAFRSFTPLFFSAFALVLLSRELAAQPAGRMWFALSQNEAPLKLGLSGGLNTPQFHAADLDLDGDDDLLVFDRTGNQWVTFRNDGSTAQPDWQFDPALAQNLPAQRNWVLVRDFNGDGLPDLFGHSQPEGISGVRVWRGYDDGGTLKFARVLFPDFQKDVLWFELANGTPTQIYVSNVDLPALEDVDQDGDLDLLTYDIGGSYLEWYRNTSAENGFGADSLRFVREDMCWGRFYESSFSQTIALSDDPDQCAQGFAPPKGGLPEALHPGSTTLVLDIDGDGDLDALIGDIISPYLILLKNSTTDPAAWMTEQDPTWPSDDTPVEIPYFAAAFLLDIDGDGLDDVMAAPNAINNAPTYQSAWWYRNTGTANAPHFELQTKSFLIEDMLDLGAGAHPAFADVDADGDLDLVVGNHSYFLPDGNHDARLHLLRNTGTPTAPAFELADADWLFLGQFSTQAWSYAPAFGDLDQDGDLDLVVGTSEGKLFFLENTAGPDQPMSFSAPQYFWQQIDVGLNARPFIADLDGDGLADLVIGETNGNVNYFPNIGTPGNPLFHPNPDEAPNNFFLGQVDATVPGDVQGYSTPVLVPNGTDWYLLTGTKAGTLELYGDVGTHLDSGPFTLIDDHWLGIDVGARSAPALADLDGDGWLDLVVGNLRGGIEAWHTPLPAQTTVATTEPHRPPRLFRLSPNPAADHCTLVRLSPNGTRAHVALLDLNGRVLWETATNDDRVEVPLRHLPKGVYLCRMRTGEGTQSELVVVRSEE